jgi:hypothetical protein
MLGLGLGMLAADSEKRVEEKQEEDLEKRLEEEEEVL